MSLQNFVDKRLPVIGADWLNSVDRQTINAFNFIPSSEWAAIIAGTSNYDATTALQSCIDQAGTGQVILPRGSYRITRPLYATAGSLHLIAHEATIRKTTNTAGTTIGTRTFNGSVDDYNVDCILGLVHAAGQYARILVEGRLQLRSEAPNPVAFGLYIPRFFYSSLRNINTLNCAIGVRGMTGILSDIVNVQCFGLNTTASPQGIQIVDFTTPNNESTSLNFNACWGVDTGRAFHVAAAYSTMINCAADRCGADIYRLDSGSMTLVGCGSEGSLNAPVFFFNGGRHRLIGCRIIQPHSGTSAVGLLRVASPAIADVEVVIDNFVDAGSATRFQVDAGATLRAYPAHIWPTNGNSPVINGTYREYGTYGSAPPVSGFHARAERVYNTAPAVDGNNMVLDHWICTVAGNPGTWVPQYISTVTPAT